jgi:Secretion system C-terminal sorting domain
MKKVILVLLSIILFGFIQSQDNWEILPLPSGFYFGGAKVLYHDTVENTLWMGGHIAYIDSTPNSNFLLKYDGTNWKYYGPFNGSSIKDICRFQDKIVFGGSFDNYNSYYSGIPNSYRYLAYIRADTVGYFDNLNIKGGIEELNVIDGELYCVGQIDSIYGMAVNNVVKFDGIEWSTVHDFPSLPDCILYYTDTLCSESTNLFCVEEYNGSIYLGGMFDSQDYYNFDGEEDYFGTDNKNIANFNGAEWELTGGGLLPGGIVESVNCMKVFQGELYLAGSISKPAGNAGNCIQKWNGTAWSSVGDDLRGFNNSFGDFNPVYDLQVHNNELYIAGYFEFAGDIPASGIVKWDGEKYCSFGPRFFESTSSVNFLNDTMYVSGQIAVDGGYDQYIFKYVGSENSMECSTVGIKQNNTLLQLNIYPSPADNHISIVLPKESFKNICVEVYNAMSQMVLKNNNLATGTNTIDIKPLVQGQYSLLLKDDGLLIGSGKFIKQ